MTSARSTTTAPNIRGIFSSLLRADFIVFLKNRRSLILSILLPYLILVSTGSRSGTAHLGGAVFIIGLAITYGIASTSIMGYSLAVARDRERGVFQRLRVTPAPTWAIMLSRLAIQVLANLIIALVVLFLGGRVHHLSLSASQYALVLGIAVLGGVVFLCIGQALVALVKSAETVNSTARLLYVGLIFLGLLGQGGSLGPTWDAVTRWSPVGTVMSLFAGVLNLGAWSAHDTGCLLASFGYVVVFAIVGIRWFRWEVR
ncbi:MAG: ABC transporter permease [Acidimicrobiales bacterium]